jgi:hypothetical protein
LKKTLLHSLFFSLLFLSCYTKKILPEDDGVCYGEIFYEEKRITEEKTILVYTGEDLSVKGLKDTILNVDTGESKWVKRKSNVNCFSKNPEDCLVWCNMPVIREEKVKLVQNPEKIRSFKSRILKEISIERLQEVKKEEVICSSEITRSMISKIENLLFDLGYIKIKMSPQRMTQSLENAIKEYQKEKKIGIGVLTRQTLDFMGILD